MGINASTVAAALALGLMAAVSDAAQDQPQPAPVSLSQQARALASAAPLASSQAAGRQRRADPLWNGAAVGAAAGLVVGLIGAERCGNDFGCSGDTWQFALLGAAVGAGIGMGIDALLDRQGGAGPPAGAHARVRLGPFVTARSRGLGARVAF